MTQKAKAILRDALSLPADQRADIAAELLDSLDQPRIDDEESAARLWAAEIERRARRALADPDGGEPWEIVRERTARKLKEQ
jgi:putative addiction module component (TIGR02574 family)